jgi:PAS domain S-box-containing protein
MDASTAQVQAGPLHLLPDPPSADIRPHEGEALFRAMLEHAPIGMALVGLDGRWRMVNRALCDILGYPREELLGLTFQEVTHPDDVAADLEQAGRLWAGEAASYEMEKRYVRRDGSTVWVHLTASVVRGPGGEPLYGIAQVQDVSARRWRLDRERFLADAGRLLASSLDFGETLRGAARLLVPRLGDWCAVQVVDDGRGEPGLEVACTRPDLEPLLHALFSPRLCRSLPAAHPVRRVMEEGRAVLFPPETEAGAGTVVGEEMYFNVLRTLGTRSGIIAPLMVHGRALGAVTLGTVDPGRDLDERALELVDALAHLAALAVENARLFRDACHAARVRDELLGMVAYDVRTPLSAIALHASALHDVGVPDEERRRLLRLIQTSTDQVDHLVRDLLDVSRSDEGRFRVEPEPRPAEPLVREAVEIMADRARLGRVRIEVDAPDDLPPVLADHGRVLQVLCNLLENALASSPPGACVDVRLRAADDEVVFSVADTGEGIPAERVSGLFDHPREPGPAGRPGLGLAICRTIVDAHGGRIEAESAPGRGSTFSFTLPAAAPEDLDPAGTPSPAAKLPLRVLLVDDGDASRAALAELLAGEAGVEVVGEAATRDAAVERAAALAPDVVLMSLELPGMGAVDATRRILALEGGTRVLALARSMTEAAVLGALDAGASGILSRDAGAAAIVPALMTAARGAVTLDPGVKQLLLAGNGSAPEEAPREPAEAPRLGTHEERILALSAYGYTSREIGRKLFLSPQTVDSYRARAMRRLGLENRADLVAFALQLGLLRTEADAAGAGRAVSAAGQAGPR